MWWVLDELLKPVGTTGLARISKILARKRLGLFPILDSVAVNRIRRTQSRSPGEDKWLFLERELKDSAHVAAGLTFLRESAKVPANVMDLRIVDIVVWFRQTTNGRLVSDYVSCAAL